jgi:hypothetical protein
VGAVPGRLYSIPNEQWCKLLLKTRNTVVNLAQDNQAYSGELQTTTVFVFGCPRSSACKLAFSLLYIFREI